MYGDGATPSAVEHRLRPIRKTAEDLRKAAVQGDSSAGEQTQPRSSRSSRTPQTPRRPRNSGTPGSGKTRSGRKDSGKKINKSVEESNDPIVIKDSSDETEIKEAIKRENERTRGLLGINRVALEDRTEDKEVEGDVFAEFLKTQTASSSTRNALPDTNMGRPAFVDSQSNAYVQPALVKTEVETEHGNVAGVLDGLLAESGKFEDPFFDEA